MALPEDLSTLKVTELKAELKKRGLAVAGLKKELVERLNDAIAAENAEQEEEEAEEEVVEEEATAEEEQEEEEKEEEEKKDDEGDNESGDKHDGDEQDAKEEVATKPEEAVAEPVEESKDEEKEVEEEKAPAVEEQKDEEPAAAAAAAAPPTDDQQDTSMQDAPAQQKEEDTEEEVKDEKMDEAPASAPEIVEPKDTKEDKEEDKAAEGPSKTASELQPTVETAAPTPMPRHEQPKSKENVTEEPTPAPSAPATTTATPVPGDAPERQMTDPDSSAETDMRKRKRRSKSPSVHESDVEAKKQRIREDRHGDRQEVVMEEAPPRDRSRTPRSSDRRDRSRTRSRTRSRSRSRTPRGRDGRTRSRTRSPTRSRSRERSRGVIHGKGGADRSRSPMSRHSRSPSPPTRQRGSITTNAKDARFKGLFKEDAQSGGQAAEAAAAASPTRSGDDSDGDVEPAQHAASRAIYISELVRPLQESQLRTHLTSLASKSNNPDVMVNLYLDQIKTHCFAVFDSVQACSRVRNGIHNKIWPNEKNRKPLFADFVPENKVAEWIDIERHERGKRFAVAYRPAPPSSDDDDIDRIEAVLEEVLPGGSTRRPFPVSGDASSVPRGKAPSDAPLGPRNPHGSGRLIQPAATNTPPGVKVVSLDELFKCTKTKPKLYYKPVSESVAKERLATKDYHKEALVAAAATRKGEFEFGRPRKRKNRGYGGGGDSWSGKDRDWDRDWVRDGGRGDRRREGKRRR